MWGERAFFQFRGVDEVLGEEKIPEHSVFFDRKPMTRRKRKSVVIRIVDVHRNSVVLSVASVKFMVSRTVSVRKA